LVPTGSHPQNLDITLGVEGFEAISQVLGLPHGKATFAGGDDEALGSSRES